MLKKLSVILPLVLVLLLLISMGQVVFAAMEDGEGLANQATADPMTTTAGNDAEEGLPPASGNWGNSQPTVVSTSVEITQVNLLTAQEAEILCDTPLTTAAEVYAAFDVLVDGEPVEYTFLSYFDFGPYASAPVINIRLAEPLVSGLNTYHTITEETAQRLVVQAGEQKVSATWTPFYTFTDQFGANGVSGARNNRGSRGLMWVWGNDNSRVTEEASVPIPVPYQTNYRTATWVIQNTASAIDRLVGRSEQLVMAANNSGMRVAVVGNGESVYAVPEHRELYIHGETTDWDTRVTIPGTRDCPVVVTTAEDVFRLKSGNDQTFELMREFARLFLELGVKDGWSLFPLGIYDDTDAYNCLKRLLASYDNSVAKGLWPGTNMTNSLEDYFVLGTMVFQQSLPESATWEAEAFPINTRAELLEYDPGLYEALAEIYGEWEWFVGGGGGTTDSGRRYTNPWYKHNQTDNYTVQNGNIVKYASLQVEQTNLISPTQIEIVFNREVKDLDELRTLSNWSVTWIPEVSNGAYEAGQTYTFNADSGLIMEYYQWKTLTLKIPDAKFNTGYMGSEIGGFTQEEIDKGFDETLTVEEGYKPWFAEDAYYRDLIPVGVNFMGDLGDISGWMGDPSRETYSLSPKVIATLSEEEIAAQKIVEARPIPRADFVGKPSALAKGEYVKFEAAQGGYVAYDKTGQALNGGAVKIPAAINGVLSVTFQANPAVCDWDGNELAAGTYQVMMNPWQKQVMRSEKTGIYVYADAETAKTSLLVGCDYWDYMFSGTYDNLGQRMADGFTFFFHHKNVKTGEYGAAGLDILGYHNHMYMTPSRRSIYNTSPTVLYAEGLGYGICSTGEYSLLRDYKATRYDHESIMHHEGAHSVEFPGMLYFTDLNYELNEIWNELMAQGLWPNSYPSSHSAEYFATLATLWFGTMRESVAGTTTGVWTAMNTREEAYAYDQKSYEFMKKIFYNGDTYLDPDKLPAPFTGNSKVPGWDENGKSINDEIIKWGLTFPSTMNEDRADWGITDEFRWVSWGAPNQWDINDRTEAGSAVRYGEDINPNYPGREHYTINYNPYLLLAGVDDSYTISFNANGGSGSKAPLEVEKGASYTLPANPFTRSNHTFNGWKINNLGNNLPAGSVITVDADLTLYAQWSSNSSSSNSGRGSSGGSPVETPVIEENPVPQASNKAFAAFITGFEDHTFRGETMITREQFVAILYRLKSGNQAQMAGSGPSFADVSANRWSYAAVEWAKAQGIITADADGNFRPGAVLSRAEMAVMFVKAEGLTEMGEQTFTDLAEHPLRDDILRAAKAGILTGYPDGSFGPDDGTKRVEAVAALVRYLLGQEPTEAMLEGLTLNFSDTPSNYWGYPYILLAVNGYRGN